MLELKLVTMRAPVELVGPGVDAMRQRQALREETDITEIADDALREILVGPGALIDGFQQMHVDAAAGSRRILGDGFEQRL
jgi:hypothetical protein